MFKILHANAHFVDFGVMTDKCPNTRDTWPIKTS